MFRVRLIALLAVAALFLSSCIDLDWGYHPPEVNLGGNQTLSIPLGDDPATLDPALVKDAESALVVRQIFSGLVTLDDDLQVQPDLAASLPEISPDGKVYTFTLRADAKFHNGRQVTAEDVKYSLERASDPLLAAPDDPSTLPAATYLSSIKGFSERASGKTAGLEGVRVLDTAKVEITLSKTDPTFLFKLAFPCAFVVDREQVGSGGDWTLKPNGSGPFRVEEWRRQELMVLIPADTYPGRKAGLREVRFLLGPEALQGLNLYEAGKVDMAWIAPDDLFRATDPASPLSKELRQVAEFSVAYVGLNLRARPFEDAKVREALYLAIDRAKIARASYHGSVEPALGLVAPGMAGYSLSSTQNFDLYRARQLLKESSYMGAENLPTILLYTTGGRLAGAVAAQWRENLGLKIEVRRVEWRDYLALLDRGEMPAFVSNWLADYPDPMAVLGPLLASGGGANHVGFSNEQFDTLLDRSNSLSGSERREVLRRAEELALSEHVVIPIFYGKENLLVKPYIKGLKLTPLGIIRLNSVYREGQ
jgi:peptide/nickel transport system substrate-binding protein/oligopeptide transport system substrate-binding protein